MATMTTFENEKRVEIATNTEAYNGALRLQAVREERDPETGEFPDHSYTSIGDKMDDSQKPVRDDIVSKRDKAFDKKWRGIVCIMLLGNALIIIGATYTFLAAQEKKDFDTTFDRYAQVIMDSCLLHARSITETFDAVSDSITSYVHNTNSQWPFVTITDFELHSVHAREVSFTKLVGFVPLISNAQRMEQWEAYAQENMGWLTESRITATKMDPKGPVEPGDLVPEEAPQNLTSSSNSTVNDGNKNDRALQQIEGPYAPVWQLSPPPSDVDVVGFDLLTHPAMEKLLFAMYESQHITISAVMDLRFLGIKESSTEDVNANETTPTSVLLQPIYNEHNFNDVNPNLETPKLQGVYLGVLSWKSYFSNLLPEDIKGIHCVVHNDCDQDFTFLINGRDAIYLGLGDHHQPKYDTNKVSTSFSEFHKDQDMTIATNSSQNKDRFQCHYSLTIYPTEDLQESLETSRPLFFTMIVALIFFATFVVLAIYYQVVNYRTSKVENVARAGNTILATLYPEEIKKKLLKDAQEAETNKSLVTSTQGSAKVSPMVNALLSASEEATYLGQSSSSGGSSGYKKYKSKPMADSFPETTIFFADIAGFTKWSSSRTPSDVFELLEAIYGCFDHLAKKRNVYKIETIGDCYVAVTGLPRPNKRHALVMVRFAQDCLAHISKVTKDLEKTLGEDTSELTMRVGLHSGPVTAGVLRGERSRFQLFGDTVNTAARMESLGKPGCIHISDATAELLRGHGRSSWLRKREDLVHAKGKGTMQTWFVLASPTESVRSSSGDGESAADASVTHFRSFEFDSALNTTSHTNPAQREERWIGDEEASCDDIDLGSFG